VPEACPTMGQRASKMCHTQEIAVGPTQEEWRPVDQWSEDVATADSGCGSHIRCRPSCCRPVDSKVEEVLVVHHQALQRVDFLLQHDELSCEQPMLPECVTAMRRTKILKRVLSERRQPEVASSRETLPIPIMGPGDDACNSSNGGDPSDEDAANMNSADVCVALQQHSGIQTRLLNGLRMWALRQDGSGDMTQEDVTFQVVDSDFTNVRAFGEKFEAKFPLAIVTCIELPSSPKAAGAGAGAGGSGRGALAEEEEVDHRGATHVYLAAATAATTYNFAFQSADDAQDFWRWMRQFQPQQVKKCEAKPKNHKPGQ